MRFAEETWGNKKQYTLDIQIPAEKVFGSPTYTKECRARDTKSWWKKLYLQLTSASYLYCWHTPPINRMAVKSERKIAKSCELWGVYSYLPGFIWFPYLHNRRWMLGISLPAVARFSFEQRCFWQNSDGFWPKKKGFKGVEIIALCPAWHPNLTPKLRWKVWLDQPKIYPKQTKTPFSSGGMTAWMSRVCM